MDASFLYAETPTSPMHVGGVVIIEGSFDYETYRNIVRSRIHLIPKLRKRLVFVPLSVDYPYWVDDPHFDIDMHLHHIALPKPGGWKELRAAASDIFSQHLDRSRPLWSFTFVEGLDSIPQVPSGSVAIISKIHHVAVDGVEGAGILSLLLNPTPEKQDIPEPKPFHPEPLPNELDLILKSSVSFASKPLKLPKLLRETVTATLKAGVLTRTQRLELPTAPFSAPPTPLNGIISARRKWNTAILSLDRVKAIKKIMGTTLNDVVLGICAGALRRYLLEKGKLPSKPLVSMVPISTRQHVTQENSGNQLSAMLVQLATDIEDPIERLEKIFENTIRGKTYQGAMGAKTLATMAEVVPFGIANQAARLYSRFNVAEMHNPVFNVLITNVPGPQLPLYMNGHKMISAMGMAPIIDGMGLIITVFSYNGLLTISPTSDVKTMPDLDDFTRYLREEANILEEAVLKHGKSAKKKPLKVETKASSDALFNHLKKYLKDNPEFLKPNTGVFQFNIIGPVETTWKLDFNKRPGSVRKGAAKEPDVTFTVKDEHIMKIARGELNVQAAFIQGRLKIKGDSSKAMRMGAILGKIPPLN